MPDNEDEAEGEGRWRRILLSGGALLGVAAAYNAFARKGVDQLTNLIGGEEGGFERAGHGDTSCEDHSHRAVGLTTAS